MGDAESDEHPPKSGPNAPSSPPRARHLAPVPTRSSSGLLQPRAPAPDQSSQSPPSLYTTPPTSLGPHRADRPPYRFRRATDSTIRRDASLLDLSNSQSLYSSRRYSNQSADRRLISRIRRSIISTGSRLRSSILTSLWTGNPNPPLRRLHLNDDHSSYFKRLSLKYSSLIGIRSPALWLALILILGLFDLWRSGDRKLDNQDWGPTRVRAGHRTGAETRRLQLQMSQSPFGILAGLGVLADSHPLSNDPFGLTGRWLRPVQRSSLPLATRGYIQPDVTAVLLNWNRLENLIVIVAHLCQYDFIDSIIIWNNNSKQILTPQNFKNTKCPNHKLSIYNSPTNNLFFSRFLACLQSKTKYCYFQDDDCIVNLIRTMYFQFKSIQVQQPRNDDDQFSVVVQADPVYSIMYNWEWCFNNRPNRLHTCFAWLGHGSFVTKRAVVEFLSLVSSEQSIPSDSVALADNFFTTSLNRQPNVIVVPEIIGLPLSNSGFSDGAAGLERNRDYIQRGVETLSNLLKSGKAFGTLPSSPETNQTSTNKAVIRAAERGDRIHLMTNVEPFPGERPDFNSFEHGLAGWEDQLGTTGYRLGRAWGNGRVYTSKPDWDRRELDIVDSSYAAAMDGNRSTSWISSQPVQIDDWVGIGWIDRPIIGTNTKMIEVHIITSAPELFQVDQVVEILQISDGGGSTADDGDPAPSTSASWDRFPSRTGLLEGFQPQQEQDGLDRMECSSLVPDRPSHLEPLKFDCVLRFTQSRSFRLLTNSRAIRVRKTGSSPRRWSIWEAYVIGIP